MSPTISASGPTNTGPRLVIVPLVFPRMTADPQDTLSVTSWPLRSIVSDAQVSSVRLASYLPMRTSSSRSDFPHDRHVTLSAFRDISCTLSQWMHVMRWRSSPPA